MNNKKDLEKNIKSEERKEEYPLTQTAQEEREILEFWNKNNIFKKSMKNRKEAEKFVFYDGPPFATGIPHYGHLVPGTIKDVFPRYKTMKGFLVERKWGWDCHGMPIENIVEKKHNLNSKKDIEEFGIDNFCKSASESIFEYKKVWEETIPKTGRWVDMKDHYKTMDPNYTESVWWAFSQFAKKGLVSKDFKPMHICPRCETTLSNRDVSEGYKDIKDLSLVAKFALKDELNTFVLAWTTTPWTLPGNVALAVGEDIDYVKVEKEDQEDGHLVKFILAKALLDKIFPKDKVNAKGREDSLGYKNEYEIISEFKGSDLIGKSYEPLFDYYSKNENLENRENGWKIYSADFVTTEDGTGVVHIAPAFGEDDLNLGRKNKLPFIQHIGMDGRFRKEITDFAGMKVRKVDFHEEVDIEIIKYLAHNGKLFSKEKYEHSYPHCWRCNTPLLNYATSSWFINVPAVKDKLVKENKKVGWVPDYIGHKRFANWLENARPWAVSRSRYWGTPMPIWENKKSGDYQILDSLEELMAKTKSTNTLTFIRHGEAESNIGKNISSEIGTFGDKLTSEGKQQAKEAGEKLKEEKIDLIFSSPFERTKLTAEIIAENVGIDKNKIIFDDRLREIDAGDKNGSLWRDAQKKDFTESYLDVKKRTLNFIYEIDKKYKNKNILIVAHGIIGGYLLDIRGDSCKLMKKATAYKIDFAPIPHNDNYELDYHRPYIDKISWTENGKEYKFIGDVFDTWFDSGSVPFASKHYPFENKNIFNPEKGINYPADFISEGLDQTRGWFYVMMVMGYVLFNKSPYKNVVVHGMLMAEDGKKMSKSLKNYPPMDRVLNTYGADALRLFLLNSSIVRGDSPSFHEKVVDEMNKKIIAKSKNIIAFYNLYKNEEINNFNPKKSPNILDKWILERTKKLVLDVTNGLEKYELNEATKPFIDYIDDLSTWYIRRSRDRFKGEDEEDKNYALATTKKVLRVYAKTIAPFAPFLAEILWKDLRDEKESESVHLEKWPEIKNGILNKLFKNNILEKMEKIREVVSVGLEARVKAGLKVRQPLESILIITSDFPNNKDYLEIIKDELNIKNISLEKELSKIDSKKYLNFVEEIEAFEIEDEKEILVFLDKNISNELKTEGDFREFLRQVQILRKKEGMNVSDRAELKIDLLESKDKSFIEKFLKELEKAAGIININYGKIDDGEEVKINDKKIKVILIK